MTMISDRNMSSDWQLAFSTNGLATMQTTASLTAKIPTTTAPVAVRESATGIIGTRGKTEIRILPIGVGASTNTGLIRVIGWKKLPAIGTTKLTDIWIPTILSELTLTLSATAGIAGTPVGTTVLFADVITIASGGAGTIYKGSLTVPAWVMINIEGYEYVELVTGLNSSATSVNALVAVQ